MNPDILETQRVDKYIGEAIKLANSWSRLALKENASLTTAMMSLTLLRLQIEHEHPMQHAAFELLQGELTELLRGRVGYVDPKAD